MIKTKRLVWTIVFLGITLVAIVMEVVAGVWHPAGTIPWTEYIAQYVPWPVQLAAYVILAVWLPFHFWRADEKRKTAYRNGLIDGHLQAATQGPAKSASVFAPQPKWAGNVAAHLREEAAESSAAREDFLAAAEWLDGRKGPAPSKALLLPTEKI